jgi:hypothetical protein
MSNLAPHQQRVVDEKRELDEKIEKLTAFFNTETYRGLRSAEQHLLSQQLQHMTGYSMVLTDRISLF